MVIQEQANFKLVVSFTAENRLETLQNKFPFKTINNKCCLVAKSVIWRC